MEMKKIIMALFAVAFAAKVEAGEFSFYWQADVDSLPMVSSDHYYVYTYVYALGNDWGYYGYPVIFENSFGFWYGERLITQEGEFHPYLSGSHTVQFHTTDDHTIINLMTCSFWNDTPELSINQWWAVIVCFNSISDPSIYGYGIDLFHISGASDVYCEYTRFLDGSGTVTGLTGIPPGFYRDSSVDWQEGFDLVDKFFDPYEYGVIPEPATGLLALVGGALLLIRRKRK